VTCVIAREDPGNNNIMVLINSFINKYFCDDCKWYSDAQISACLYLELGYPFNNS